MRSAASGSCVVRLGRAAQRADARSPCSAFDADTRDPGPARRRRGGRAARRDSRVLLGSRDPQRAAAHSSEPQPGDCVARGGDRLAGARRRARAVADAGSAPACCDRRRRAASVSCAAGRRRARAERRRGERSTLHHRRAGPGRRLSTCGRRGGVPRWERQRTAAFLAGLLAIAVALGPLDGAADEPLSGAHAPAPDPDLRRAAAAAGGRAAAAGAGAVAGRDRRVGSSASPAGARCGSALAAGGAGGLRRAPPRHARPRLLRRWRSRTRCCTGSSTSLTCSPGCCSGPPVLAPSPLPRTLSPLGRVLYLLFAMLPGAAIGLWLMTATGLAYPAYAPRRLGAAAALADQWHGGDGDVGRGLGGAVGRRRRARLARPSGRGGAAADPRRRTAPGGSPPPGAGGRRRALAPRSRCRLLPRPSPSALALRRPGASPSPRQPVAGTGRPTRRPAVGGATVERCGRARPRALRAGLLRLPRPRRARRSRASPPTCTASAPPSADFYLRTGRMPLANPDQQPERTEPAYSNRRDRRPRRLRRQSRRARRSRASTLRRRASPRTRAVHRELRRLPPDRRAGGIVTGRGGPRPAAGSTPVDVAEAVRGRSLRDAAFHAAQRRGRRRPRHLRRSTPTIRGPRRLGHRPHRPDSRGHGRLAARRRRAAARDPADRGKDDAMSALRTEHRPSCLRLLLGADRRRSSGASAAPVRRRPKAYRPSPSRPTRERDAGAAPRATGAVAALLLGGGRSASPASSSSTSSIPDTQLLGLCLGLGVLVVGRGAGARRQGGGPAGAGRERLPRLRRAAPSGEQLERRRSTAAARGSRGATCCSPPAAPRPRPAAPRPLAPLASLGPSPGRTLFATPWQPGRVGRRHRRRAAARRRDRGGDDAHRLPAGTPSATRSARR